MAVYRFSKVTQAEGYKSGIHAHHFYEIYILQKGKRQYIIQNEIYDMENDTIVCVPPNFIHNTEGGAFTRYCICFTLDFIDEKFLDILNRIALQPIKMTADESNHIYTILRQLEKEKAIISKDKERQEYRIQTILSYFLLYVSGMTNAPTKEFIPLNDYHVRTKKIIAYINENYMNSISLDTLSRKFMVCKTALCKEFKDDTGMTIYNFLTQYRLKEAASLLVLGKMKAQKIAEICGFSSPKFFSKVFKKQYSCTPKQYQHIFTETVNLGV